MASHVLPPCVLPSASLRSKEKCLRLFVFVRGRHGNGLQMHAYQVSYLRVINKFDE